MSGCQEGAVFFFSFFGKARTKSACAKVLARLVVICFLGRVSYLFTAHVHVRNMLEEEWGPPHPPTFRCGEFTGKCLEEAGLLFYTGGTGAKVFLGLSKTALPYRGRIT